MILAHLHWWQKILHAKLNTYLNTQLLKDLNFHVTFYELTADEVVSAFMSKKK